MLVHCILCSAAVGTGRGRSMGSVSAVCLHSGSSQRTCSSSSSGSQQSPVPALPCATHKRTHSLAEHDHGSRLCILCVPHSASRHVLLGKHAQASTCRGVVPPGVQSEAARRQQALRVGGGPACCVVLSPRMQCGRQPAGARVAHCAWHGERCKSPAAAATRLALESPPGMVLGPMK
jgi:hypothetical protein